MGLCCVFEPIANGMCWWQVEKTLGFSGNAERQSLASPTQSSNYLGGERSLFARDPGKLQREGP